MTRILAITIAILSLCGCQHRSIADGTVELAPHTYAMDHEAFDAWALNHGHRQDIPIPMYSISDQCGTFRPYPSTVSSDTAHMDLEGLTVWRPHGGTICVIRCYDPHHLTFDDQCKLYHELGHREDYVLGSEGASHFWHLLCLMPNGRFFLTHPNISARLRREGYLK